jgi:hypothetical protein
MKTRMKFISLLLLLTMSGIVSAKTTAADLQVPCKAWIPNFQIAITQQTAFQSYQAGKCAGFVGGWQMGVEGTLAADDKGFLQTVTFEDGVTAIQMAKVFSFYMDNHPEEENKPAQVALMHAMLDAKLVTLVSPGKDVGK